MSKFSKVVDELSEMISKYSHNIIIRADLYEDMNKLSGDKRHSCVLEFIRDCGPSSTVIHPNGASKSEIDYFRTMKSSDDIIASK